MWVLSSFKREFGFFFLPAILAILIAILFPHLGEASLLYGLLATAIIDSGHVYITVFRTFLHPDVRRLDKKFFFTPLLIFIFFLVGFTTLPVWIWKIVVYATIFHHLRQVYGFSRWYHLINGKAPRSQVLFFTVILLTIMSYHLRPGAYVTGYSTTDFFFYPDAKLRTVSLVVYFLAITCWFIYEGMKWKKDRETNLLIFQSFQIGLFSYCFLLGHTLTQVLFPLIISHGVSYAGVMGQTLHRTQEKRYPRFQFAMLMILILASVFGLFESWLEEFFINTRHSETSLTTSLILAFYLTPLFSHYIFDAWIWKKNYPEGSLVYQTKPQ